jgi:Leucine-rich repeat (LRR) protein
MDFHRKDPRQLHLESLPLCMLNGGGLLSYLKTLELSCDKNEKLIVEYDIDEYFNSLPLNIKHLDLTNIQYLNNRSLMSVPSLERFEKLEKIYMYNNKIIVLPQLPHNLSKLFCFDNALHFLPKLSTCLMLLDCSGNYLTNLPELPSNLQHLNCCNNQIRFLPPLPSNLKELYCSQNYLTTLPPLPVNLKDLYCANNQLTTLENLPSNLKTLHCADNKLITLPALPLSLNKLYCSNNKIFFLQQFLPNLDRLICDNNKLIHLPYLNKEISLSFFNNPVSKIIRNSITVKMNSQIKILKNFCFLYFSLKFKKKFIQWYFKAVEPTIMDKYHLRHLDNLSENDDLDMVLEEW